MSAAFIVGTGRCGSTLLSSLLHAHPEVLSLSEVFTALSPPKLFAFEELDGSDLAALLGTQDAQLKDYLHAGPMDEVLHYHDENGGDLPPLLLATLPQISKAPAALHQSLLAYVHTLPRARLAVQLERVFAFLAAQLGRTVWIERSGNVLEYIEHVTALWPAAHLICLLRNGPESAFSMSRHPAFRVRVARLVARDPWFPVGECLAMDVPLHRYGAYWSALMVNKLLPTLKAAAPQNVHVLRYEQLLADPSRELCAIFEHMRLSMPSPGVLGVMAQKVRPSRSDLRTLPGRVQRDLERACRPGTRALDSAASFAARGFSPASASCDQR